MASFPQYLFGRAEAPNLPYNPPQIPERFLTQAPVPEMQMRDVQQGLVGAKSDWDNADKSMQWWTKQLDTPDLTDEQKQKINANIEGWDKMRTAAADKANAIRTQADALGVDVSDYGAGKTLQEASQAYDTYRNTAMRDFLRLPSVRELEENRYLELRNGGASPRQAERILGRERAGRQEDFLKRVTEGVMTYGVNPDGETLNPFGLSMMQKLDPSNPELTARLFASGFAMPKDMFSEDRADNRVRMTNDATAQRQADQIKYNTWHDIYSNDQTNARLTTTLEHQSKENALERGSREHIALLNATVRRAGGGSKDNENKILEKVATLVDLGVPEEQAKEIVIRQEFPKFFDDLKSDKKILEDKKAFATVMDGKLGTIEYFLQTDNRATAKELIGKCREFIQSDEFKYIEQMDADGAKFLLETLNEYEQVADGKMTYAQMMAKRKRYPESPAGLSQANYDEQLNEDAKKTGEEAAIKQRQRRDMAGNSSLGHHYPIVTGKDGKQYYVTEMGFVEKTN